MQGGLIYISPMLNNRSMKLLTIYIALYIPLHNIFVRKEKYHISILQDLCNIIFKLQESYITVVGFPRCNDADFDRYVRILRDPHPADPNLRHHLTYARKMMSLWNQPSP